METGRADKWKGGKETDRRRQTATEAERKAEGKATESGQLAR